jgi:hypothetical protein
MKPTKTITIWQPWATLIALLEKGNETRGWPTKHRGPLAIHAAKKIDYEACEREPIKSVLAKHGYTAENLPTGVIVAKCNLVECWKVARPTWPYGAKPVELTASDGKRTKIWSGNVEGNIEYHLGNYDDGRFAWELADVERLAEPIPAKGQQGLWNWDENSRMTVLNSIPFFDWSAGCGELEYVLAKKTDEHIKQLREAGFTELEIAEATDNDHTDIDLAMLAFNYAGATNWSKEKGFFHWSDEGTEAGETE